MTANTGERNGKANRGFAAMNPEMQRAIASRGGLAAHRSGHAHRFTSEEAREAGAKSRRPTQGATGGDGTARDAA